MRHFILTRSCYPPDQWPEADNRRRLNLLRGITAASLWSQTNRDWTWVVLLDTRDPFKEERRKIVQDAAPNAEFIEWDTFTFRDFARKKIASYGYGGGWQDGWQKVVKQDDTQGTLTTRLDDDDAVTPDFVARLRSQAERVGEGDPHKHPRRQRRIWQFPNGYRVWDGNYMHVTANNNAWATLQTVPGDPCVVYDFLHGNAYRFGQTPVVDNRRAFLWVRHQDTLSEWQMSEVPIDDALRSEFLIDWSLLTKSKQLSLF